MSRLKDFILYFDELMSWRASHSDEELEELNWEAKLHILCAPQIDLPLDREQDGIKCPFEIGALERIGDLAFQVPPPTVFPQRIAIG